MIAWLLPAGFGAFAALAVPLLIHWMRRSDRRIVSFAAERYLREQPHPREDRAWHERVLLLLRLLLLASLALLLAWPVWRGGAPPASPTPVVIVAPGIDAAAAHAALDEPRADWHWLEEGAPFTSQLRALDAALAPGTAVTVLVPEDLSGLDAERLRLSHALTWRAVPGRSPPDPNEGQSPAAPAPASPAPVSLAPPLTLAVRYAAVGTAGGTGAAGATGAVDAAGAPRTGSAPGMTEVGVLRAVAAAWAAAGVPASVEFGPRDAPLPPLTTWLVWLGGADLPPNVDAWIRAGGRALASRQTDGDGEAALSDAAGVSIFRERRLGAGRLLSLAGPLLPDAVPALRSPRFPQELYALMSEPSEPPNRAPAKSVVPLVRAPSAGVGSVRALAPEFALAAALLFLIERSYATRRRT
jgi:hypothetical protein